jgi:hypothetical protein
VGSHQFHQPSTAISDGTSSARTIVASTTIATARPSPNSCSPAIRPSTAVAEATLENRRRAGGVGSRRGEVVGQESAEMGRGDAAADQQHEPDGEHHAAMAQCAPRRPGEQRRLGWQRFRAWPDLYGCGYCRAHGLSSVEDEAAMASRGVDADAAHAR